MMEGPVLSAEEVTVRYGRAIAVDGVSLEVPAGSVCALLGRNGAGKSSLVRCLLGQRRPERGQISIFGEDVWQKRVSVMARVGVVPETPDAPPDLTTEQISKVLAPLYSRWDKAALEQRLERFSIPRRTRFGQLSRGQKAQVSLSLALATDSELLILDDPTLGLDAVARRAVLEELVDALATGRRTVLITTHDLAGIEGIADRVAIMKKGRMLVDEALEELKGRFRTICWKGSDARVNGFETVCRRVQAWGSEAVVSNYQDDWVGEGCEVSPMSLEEIFIALCGDEQEPGP